MPRTEKQFEEIREKSRQKILSAALELFTRNGYEATSIESIAKKARISKGLVYNYYESKKGLLLAIFDEAMQQGNSMVKRHDKEIDPYKRMRGMIEDAFKFMYENPEYLKLLFMLSLQPGVLKHAKEYTDKMYKHTLEMIGSIYSNTNEKDPYQGLMMDAMLDGIMLNYIRYGEQYPINKLKQRIIEEYCTPKKK